MKWKEPDLVQYEKAKEYIDTVIIPLVPFQMSNDEELEKMAFQAELLSIFANEIEKELAGRVMLVPTYSYLKSSDRLIEGSRMNLWIEDIKEQPFTNVFLLTFDGIWKKNEQDLTGNLLWLPAMQSGDLQSKEMKTMIRNQVTQIRDLIRSYW